MSCGYSGFKKSKCSKIRTTKVHQGNTYQAVSGEDLQLEEGLLPPAVVADQVSGAEQRKTYVL